MATGKPGSIVSLAGLAGLVVVLTATSAQAGSCPDFFSKLFAGSKSKGTKDHFIPAGARIIKSAVTNHDRRMMDASYEGLGRDGQPVETAWAAILSHDGRIIYQTEIQRGGRGAILGRFSYWDALENLKRYYRHEIENAQTLVFIHTHPADFRYRPDKSKVVAWKFSEPDIKNAVKLRQEIDRDPDLRRLTIEPHILYYDTYSLDSEIVRKFMRLKKVGYSLAP